MSYKLESDVIQALDELLENKVNCDVIILVGEKPNFKEFRAHSVILGCRSKYFNEILFNGSISKKNGKYKLAKQNIAPHAFDMILKYIYTGHIDINGKSGPEILDIMVASDELKLEQLSKLTEEFVITNYQQYLQNDPVGIFQAIYNNKSFIDLKEFCLQLICSEPEMLFDNDTFIDLPAPLLEIILGRDDLNLTEIEIWENLINWGLAQEQTLDHDVTKWNQDDFDYFQGILYNFVPLIRFYLISSDDYYNKIKPYENIFSDELKDDLLKFHTNLQYRSTVKVSPRISSRHSVIIDQNQDYLAIFASWIDKRGDNNRYTKNIPYKFNLLYRVSRDGNAAETFHKKCDNKGATLIIIKLKGSEQIIGGYNSFNWDSRSGYKSSTDCFIFTFTDRRNMKTARVGYSSGISSIGCYSSNGPIFGGYFYCRSDALSWTAYSTNYFNLEGFPNRSIKAEDYEVFQVLNNRNYSHP